MKKTKNTNKTTWNKTNNGGYGGSCGYSVATKLG
ncbi:hypothetical protein C5S53_00790, partial [Methanophagales archaeon]